MTAVTAEHFDFFVGFLRERSAISIGPGKEYLVESRLNPLARDVGLRDVNELIGQLRRPAADPAVRDRVIEAMTTNETSFFRDSHPFDALRTQVMPEVLRANAATRTLRIWSAASSTGQELYTIAMLLDTHFPQLRDWTVTLHGTDLSTDVLARARAGRFSALEINRGLPATMMVKYFERDGADYVIDQRLRAQCRFEQANLAGVWPALPRFDIVFCRNVLIYFDVEIRARILSKIRANIGPDGYLFLGSTESTIGVADGFTRLRVADSVVYRPDTHRSHTA